MSTYYFSCLNRCLCSAIFKIVKHSGNTLKSKQVHIFKNSKMYSMLLNVLKNKETLKKGIMWPFIPLSINLVHN